MPRTAHYLGAKLEAAGGDISIIEAKRAYYTALG